MSRINHMGIKKKDLVSINTSDLVMRNQDGNIMVPHHVVYYWGKKTKDDPKKPEPLKPQMIKEGTADDDPSKSAPKD